MNNTSHGRWGRYRVIRGETHKLCNGPLHKEEGEWMPLHSFWILKKGPRKGKPLSRCQACERIAKGRDPESGLVPVDRVWFVFVELEHRLGRAETCRQLGISYNMWHRVERRVYRQMYRKTAKAAMFLLRELRANNVARHKDSIKYGASMRGKQERTPIRRRDFNGKDDTEAETRRLHRRRIKSST